MRKLYFSLLLIVVCQLSFAQLKIYQNFNLQGTTGSCLVNTVYNSTTIPGGLNNSIKSISLDSGFMATLADNDDGTGERFTFMAAKSNLNVNLSLPLQNKVSFIRVLPLPNTRIKKKGVGATNATEANQLNATWGYSWGLDAIVPASREFTPMAWGASGANETNLNFILNKDSITHYLAFNEPDNPGQANLWVKNAVPLYKKMMRNGLRTGSPVCTEGKWNTWLDSFYQRTLTGDITGDTTMAVDFITLHWYDWGNWSSTGNAFPTGQEVFNRFRSHIISAYNKFQKPLWITEFNANINRDSTVHLAFMQLALPFLDTCRMVERYAYFFGNDVKSRKSDGSLTPLGQYYSSYTSANAYTENVYDKRTPYAETTLAAWEASQISTGGLNDATFPPTTLNANITANTPLSRGTGLLLPPSNSSNGYWGATNFSTISYADAISTNKILKFALQGNTGNYLNYTSLDKFNIRINNIGPVNYVLTYQIMTGTNAGTVTTITTITGTPAVTGNYSFGPFDLTGFTNLQNVPSGSYVIFRIVPYGGSSSSGSFLIGSGTGDTNADLSVRGFTSPTTLIIPNSVQAPLASRVITIDNMQPTSIPLVAYPTINTSNSIKATFKSVSKNAFLKVINMNGQVMAVYSLQEGVNNANINTNNLQKGSYVLILEDGNSVQNTRFIKQ